ncbi:MAG: PAS domain-containing protein [Vicinamibacteria bacterium]|nr:PAS domain-containing protein [Vicinamibacteria bacterium]
MGASAGGLEAFSELLRHLALDTGMGFVLVQHLDPQHDSALTRLLGRATSLPVCEVTNNLRVEPNHVYVIPPNTNLGIAGGVLTLQPRAQARTPHRPIDLFFEALAADQGERAIGVILSGTATDGTLGLEAIKAEGGATFAQDESARYGSMPRSAVAAGCVDFVLSPERIAHQLARLAKHPSGAGAAKATQDGFETILRLLRDHTGVDFSLYKSSTIRRRITRRMGLNSNDTPEQYARFLRGNVKELGALYADALISVTSFFRNPDAFDVLKRTVWPARLQQRGDEPLRAWVLGCSTGQEAYSIAMAFVEAAEKAPRMRSLQVFATDLNDALLDKARHGLYAKSVAQDLSPQRLRRFFVEEEGGYRVSKSLREMVVFARQDATSDPPFSHMDLISCRNLLIYFAPGLQKKVLPVFHYALNPGGFLLLGASESIGGFTELFEPVDKKHRIYVRKTASPSPLALPRKKARGEAAAMSAVEVKPGRAATARRLARRPIGGDARRMAEVEAELAETRQYLRSIQEQHVAAREELQASNEEVQTANEELQGTNEELESSKEELESANEELTTVNEEMAHRNADLNRLNADMVNVQTSAHLPIVLLGRDLTIRRFSLQAAKHFKLVDADVGRPIGHVRHSLDLPDLEPFITDVVETLQPREREVQDNDGRWYSLRVRPYLTLDNKVDGAVMVLVDIDALKRSEHASTAARDYAENVVETVRQPLLVLNRQLRVESANRAFYRIFRVAPAETVGRFIYDLGNREWEIPELRVLLEAILPKNTVVEDFQVEHRFKQLGHRTMLLNARRVHEPVGTTERILLAFDDITERKQAEDASAEADRRKNEFLAMLAHELRNPLAPIRNALEIIRRAKGNESMTSPMTATPTHEPATRRLDAGHPVDSAVDMLERQVGQMVRLVDDLLDANRISRGKLELRRDRVELSSVVYHAVEGARPLCESLGQKLTVTLPPDAVYLNADPTRLAQIVGNLLNNASKFTDRGGRIWLTVERGTPDVVIRVRDTGIGIASDQLPRIFDMFMQVDTSIERSVTGLGIGLTLVRTLVQMHGGTIDVSSGGVGLGSEFVVHLPLMVGTPAPPPEPATTVPAATGALRILVVDDNRDSVESLAMLLQFSGHETHMAHDGVEAVEAAARLRPDVILLDIGLPGLNGYEAARRIREEQKEGGPVLVALTGWGQEEDRRRSEEAGFDAHLVKPVDFAALGTLLIDLGAGNRARHTLTRPPHPIP